MSNLKRFTLFVDGLPNNMNSRWLKNIFKYKGDVVDVYVSFKNRKTTTKIFGFVRFQRKEEAECAISSLDGKRLNSHYLKVRWARFERHNSVHINHDPQYVHRKDSFPFGFKDNLFLASLEEKLKNKFDNFSRHLLSQFQ